MFGIRPNELFICLLSSARFFGYALYRAKRKNTHYIIVIMALEGKCDMSSFQVIVLLAVDDTEYSEYAFDWYRDFVHKKENFLILLHCNDHDFQTLRDASPGKTKKMVVDMTQKIKWIEDKFSQLMFNAGISGRIQHSSGKPGETIIKTAIDEGASMIVTGTRGHGKLKRTFLGSVSDFVVHHSPVPVIICRKN